jgi:hypothetical protein
MAQPPALKSVLVAVSWAGSAGVYATDAVAGSSTVQALPDSVPGHARVSPLRVVVNGVPALGPSHPLAMGDCVRILPRGERASFAAASRMYLCTAPRPLVALQRDLMQSLWRDASKSGAPPLA